MRAPCLAGKCHAVGVIAALLATSGNRKSSLVTIHSIAFGLQCELCTALFRQARVLKDRIDLIERTVLGADHQSYKNLDYILLLFFSDLCLNTSVNLMHIQIVR